MDDRSAAPPVQLVFETAGVRLHITPLALAPRTFSRLLECLPMRIDLHCAKIAGNHILWHAPFLAPPEAASDVMAMPPGAFLYWPDRQFLELVFAPLQAETAAITPLGQVTDQAEVTALATLGARVQREQGQRMLWASLSRADASPAPSLPPPLADRLASLRAARRAIWREPPAEIARLMASRSIMHPAGPLLMAESEARKLHELATALWLRARSGEPGQAAWAAQVVLQSAIGRIDGFCNLHDSGATLHTAAALLAADPDASAAVLEELALYAGRLAAWLDARLPWQALNEACIAADDGFTA